MTLDREHVASALPGYEIGDEIGRGGWGVVLRGRHRQLGRDVAIKELPRAFAADPNVQRRFASEARVLATLDHPHIVPIYDYVENSGMCLLVMEFLPGGTVWQRLNAQGVSAETACSVVIATCSALHYAHGRGVLHRDIKPDNLLFTANGSIKLSDFGIAKVVGGNESLATRTGEVLGTPAYMAPEQALGEELTPATDIYALGTVLYELLSGRLPFVNDGNSIQVLYRHVHEPAQSLASVAPQLPEALTDVAMRSIATDPLDRYATAEDFGVALADAASETLGAGWVVRGGVPVMASGSIGARISGGTPALDVPTLPRVDGPPTTEPVYLVKEPAPPTIVETPREESLALDELVPVSDIIAHATPSAVAAKPPTEATTAQSSRRRRGRWMIAVAALVAVAVVVVILAASSSDSGHSHTRSAPRVAATIALPAAGDHAAFASGAVFLTGHTAELLRIDPATNGVSTGAALSGASHAIATDGTTIWVSVSNTVERADPSHQSTSVGESVHELAFGENALWATTSNLVRLDPSTTSVTATIAAGPNLDSVAVSDGSVWVANRQSSGTITRVDPTTNRVTATIAVGNDPDEVATGAGAVWVVNSGSGTVSRIDPTTNSVVATIRLGGRPVWVNVGLDAVWVTDSAGDRVVRIDPATNAITGSVTVGRSPQSAAIGAGSLWVVNGEDQSVSRINPGT